MAYAIDWDSLLDRAEKLLEQRAAEIREGIKTKRTNSGKAVNSLDLPAEASGNTSRSVKVVSNKTPLGFNVSLVGRKGIINIDKGNSPQDAQEHGSIEQFTQVIGVWAREKESRYGLEFGSINETSVAKRVWEDGGVLFRSGGGTEIIQGNNAEIAAQIEEFVTAEFDNEVSIILKQYL